MRLQHVSKITTIQGAILVIEIRKRERLDIQPSRGA